MSMAPFWRGKISSDDLIAVVGLDNPKCNKFSKEPVHSFPIKFFTLGQRSFPHLLPLLSFYHFISLLLYLVTNTSLAFVPT